MWWILIIIVIVICIIFLSVVIVYARQSAPPPPPPPPKPCPAEANLLYNGVLNNLPRCDTSGTYNGSDYGLVYPGVKTILNFRPTSIDGDYKFAIITKYDDNVTQDMNITDHQAPDTQFFVINHPERVITLPNDWYKTQILLHR